MTEIIHRMTVPAALSGKRLDRALAVGLPVLSRNRIKALILDGRVSVGDSTIMKDPAQRVGAGQILTIAEPPPSPALPMAEDIPLDIVFEDSHLLVLDKPPGLVVHPAAGHPDGTLVNALLHHCHGQLSGIGGVTRPGIVHRLDKDTGGLMVVAKSDAAHRGLSRMFHDHDLERAYIALVWGCPQKQRGRLETMIGRSPRNRKKMAVLTTGGRRAVTDWQLLEAVGRRASLVRCRLETGRTHQIRVHMASLGHPVVGDPLYGGGARVRGAPAAAQQDLAAHKAQALYANYLAFEHPVTRESLKFESIKYHYINELIAILKLL